MGYHWFIPKNTQKYHRFLKIHSLDGDNDTSFIAKTYSKFVLRNCNKGLIRDARPINANWKFCMIIILAWVFLMVILKDQPVKDENIICIFQR